MRAPVVALLGPTNTGKTYVAMERMLAHATGMIGFPLRLLARENYDRVVRARGAASVALVTGEERIVPPSPSYYVCTVEAMPLERRVDFMAVDEVQLAADRERGHVFTDRILHARGLQETMLLGAETIRPLLRALVPHAGFITRPRLSTLSCSPPVKLARLPRRTAVVAFSVADLYALAERLRRESGGAAVVFGGLSPRTRNAQVGLYQAGEVDFLVATDAIGMGLNLDIQHVAFTALVKFDGVGPRALRPAEVAQIAGRAGRHVRDGTFGATTDLGALDPALVEAVQNHRFEPLASIYWRNAELSFASPAALIGSLERRPPSRQLVRMRHADDHRALESLSRDPGVLELARDPESVRLLWEVCRIPDFRNLQGTLVRLPAPAGIERGAAQPALADAYTRLLRQVYRHLMGPGRRLPEDWVAAQVSALDRVEGDIDALLARIAAIRTWTYVSHRPAWLHDAAHWQERTRAVEDRLSDTLHERLTEQFVDRRAAVLSRYEPGALLATVGDDGEVLVQGLRAGRLEGFRFVPDAGLRDGSRGLLAAANRALRAGIGDRVRRLTEDDDAAFALDRAGGVSWRDAVVARLAAGEDLLSPRLDVLASELMGPPLRERIRRRLAAWLEGHLRRVLAALYAARDGAPGGTARGLVFALTESLGSVARSAVASQLAVLGPGDRQSLQRLGVVVGGRSVYLPALLGRDAVRLRGVLWAARHAAPAAPLSDAPPSVPADAAVPARGYEACGYRVAGPRAVRVDRLEWLAAVARRLARAGPFAPSAETCSILGASAGEVAGVLQATGYAAGPDGRLTRREPARRDGPTKRTRPRSA